MPGSKNARKSVQREDEKKTLWFHLFGAGQLNQGFSLVKVLWLLVLLVAFLVLKRPDSTFIYGGF